MQSKPIQTLLMLSVLGLALAGCQSIQKTTISDTPDCKPVAPQLAWYRVESGGIYYPERSYQNLMMYIEALNNCIDDHQSSAG